MLTLLCILATYNSVDSFQKKYLCTPFFYKTKPEEANYRYVGILPFCIKTCKESPYDQMCTSLGIILSKH